MKNLIIHTYRYVMKLLRDHGDCGCKTQFSNNTWAVQHGQHHLLSRKSDKGSSNKSLCVYGCASGEKSLYGR
ncbi:hypothetical protein H8356DRAFT_1436245 [Neocallimastix lanati (nom. inval.)]|nr:hypothetical protein H8356DRAFT_1436245 [Neocallimastix sp. JGI-2020a]